MRHTAQPTALSGVLTQNPATRAASCTVFGKLPCSASARFGRVDARRQFTQPQTQPALLPPSPWKTALSSGQVPTPLQLDLGIAFFTAHSRKFTFAFTFGRRKGEDHSGIRESRGWERPGCLSEVLLIFRGDAVPTRKQHSVPRQQPQAGPLLLLATRRH